MQVFDMCSNIDNDAHNDTYIHPCRVY